MSMVFPGFVALYGLESPGLTSALAIGARVADHLKAQGDKTILLARSGLESKGPSSSPSDVRRREDEAKQVIVDQKPQPRRRGTFRTYHIVDSLAARQAGHDVTICGISASS